VVLGWCQAWVCLFNECCHVFCCGGLCVCVCCVFFILNAGVGVRSNNGIPLTIDTIDIYDCGDDGVRLTNGTSLTVVAGYVHNNGGSGIVIGEQIIPDDDDDDKNNKNKNKKTTKSDKKNSKSFDDASGGGGGGGGGSGGASGQKEENDGWGDMSNTEEMKSKATEKELKDIPTADLTNCQLSCNNYSGLFVGDKSVVSEEIGEGGGGGVFCLGGLGCFSLLALFALFCVACDVCLMGFLFLISLL
jgi:hypothetical protein